MGSALSTMSPLRTTTLERGAVAVAVVAEQGIGGNLNTFRILLHKEPALK